MAFVIKNMTYDLFEFVNREKELKLFTSLLSHRRHRILFLQAITPGMGKSYLLRRLRNECKNRNVSHVFIDFRVNAALTQSSQLIQQIRKQIGGTFSDQLGEFERELGQNFQSRSDQAPFMQGEILSEVIQSFSTGSGNHLSLSGNIQIDGDLVGRDKITFTNSPIILDPSRGRELVDQEIEARRNMAFQSALVHLLQTQKVVFFFDHCEEALNTLINWIRHNLLSLYVDGLAECSNLRIVMAGQQVPLLPEVQHLFRSHTLGPLDEEAIQLFWQEKRGLDPKHLPTVVPASGGNPLMLFTMANNIERTYEY